MQQSQGSFLKINQDLGGATQQVAMILGLMSRMNTCELVQVISVDNDTVSVMPLLYKIDADNNAVNRGMINNVPFFRLQGGMNAIVIDPKPNDIGICLFASRDISMVKRKKGKASPNTSRQYDISDALYIGGVLNADYSQYIEFLDSGMNIKSTGDININGLVIKADGTLITKGGIVIDTHIHTQGNDSRGDTEQPTDAPMNGV
jgi:hypothetical protein